jgi:hypothetical protein
MEHMEPAASAASLGAKALSVIKDLPLWLLAGIALSLATFLSISKFRGAVSEETQTWITVAAITSAIFTVSRFAGVIISKIKAYRAGLEAPYISSDANNAPMPLGSSAAEGWNSCNANTH